MTWSHLTTFLWLRWRLLANQWRRAGKVNAVLMTVVAVAAVVLVVPLFLGCFAIGLYAIPKAQPVQLLFAWDGLVVAFLIMWCVGMLIELQASEPLALSRFMHLPVSPHGAFLINYVSSLLRLSLLVFGPVMLGFALALVVAKGVMLLPALPLLAAFLLMVTGLTYQFQGWLGALMSNPRRRRTVVVVVTMLFVLVCQLPNLLNFAAMSRASKSRERVTRSTEKFKSDMDELARAVRAKEIRPDEAVRRQQTVLRDYQSESRKPLQETFGRMEQVARIANSVLPIGWLPMGVLTLSEGRVVPSLLGLVGMTLIGGASLRRAYRTSVGQYQGQATNRSVPASRADDRASTGPVRTCPRPRMLEARLPWAAEPVSAVALAGLQSLVRAPEAKMMLLSPLITALIFGSMLWNAGQKMPEIARPLVAIGAMGFVLMGMLQLMGNQFGFDREGFRVFVLSAAARRDILAGKNLAFAPLVLGVGLTELVVVQLLCPMGIDHVLSMPPLFVSMFLLFCLFANLMSIYTPVYLAAGSMKAGSPKLTTGLLQFGMFLIGFPLTQLPVLLPLGVKAGLELTGHAGGIPVCLVLSLSELAVIAFIYRIVLELQGTWLQAREQVILEVVTKRTA